MAPTRAYLPPSVRFEHFDKVPNLHRSDLTPCRRWIQSVSHTHPTLYTIKRGIRGVGLAKYPNNLPNREVYSGREFCSKMIRQWKEHEAISPRSRRGEICEVPSGLLVSSAPYQQKRSHFFSSSQGAPRGWRRRRVACLSGSLIYRYGPSAAEGSGASAWRPGSGAGRRPYQVTA